MADGTIPGTTRGPQAIEIRAAARLENLAMLRAVAAAIGAVEDLNADGVADLRLAVDEACTCLIRLASPDAALTVVIDPTDGELMVEVSAACDNDQGVAEDSFSWHVLSTLADDLHTFHDGREPGDPDRVMGIRLTMRPMGPAR